MKEKLDDMIDRVEHLPPSPRVLLVLLEIFKQPDRDVNEVVRLISHDPAFTAETLRRCNSAYFSGSKPAEDIFEAVSRLGFEEIFNIVLAMFASSAIVRPEVGSNSHVEILWRHSVAAAVAASVFAKETGESSPAAFTAGLLHEVGKVVMVSANKSKYTQAVLDTGRFKRAMIVTEADLFGFDHAQVGARLLERWSLPANIVAAVRHHHELDGAQPHERLAATVHLANLVAHATGEKLTGNLKPLPSAAASLAILQLTHEQVAGLLPVMLESLENARALTPA